MIRQNNDQHANVSAMLSLIIKNRFIGMGFTWVCFRAGAINAREAREVGVGSNS